MAEGLDSLVQSLLQLGQFFFRQGVLAESRFLGQTDLFLGNGDPVGLGQVDQPTL